jgi:ABC-type sugar transport system substrate-binding protein
MRRTLTTLAAAVALGTFLIGVVHSADEEELSTDLMQSIEDTNKSLASNIATQNAKGATSDAKELNEMFSQVETFYVHKSDAVDAVELARKSKNLSAEIIRQVDAKAFDKATNTATDLSRACKTCHNFYKKS